MQVQRISQGPFVSNANLQLVGITERIHTVITIGEKRICRASTLKDRLVGGLALARTSEVNRRWLL